MHVWLVRDLEPIPTDPGVRRQMRAAMLAQAVVDAGHSVRWITSSFDHYFKRQRSPRRQEIGITKGYTVSVLPGRGYSRNISLARIAHNRDFASKFLKFAGTLTDRPDVIVTDIPTTETAAAVVDYGRREGIPSCVEIVDLWPDFFPSLLPRPMRRAGGVAVWPLARQARFACSHATSLVGISPGYLQWGLDKAGRARSAFDAMFPLGYAPVSIPSDEERNDYLETLEIGPDKRVVAFVGSWGQTYDLELIHDAALCLKEREDIVFVVTGSGDRGAQIGPRLAGLPNVVTPGWIAPKQIAALLTRAEIGLLPYTSTAPQGLPNKVFEYLAYGTYQVATIEGELASFYAQTGAGVCTGNWNASVLASEIIRVLADDELCNGRAARRAQFDKQYSQEAIYPRLVNHLVSVSKRDDVAFQVQ